VNLFELRRHYHQRICREIIRISTHSRGHTFPNFADGSSRSSVLIASGIVARLEYATNTTILTGQTAGGYFEVCTRDYLEEAFTALQHLRPGNFRYATHTPISDFDQYDHLAQLQRLVKKLLKEDNEENNELATALGQDYIITPDIVVSRSPLEDSEINARGKLVDATEPVAQLTPLRSANSLANSPRQMLHASISCKWTLRSDRSQNARTEGLNLIRNRKGSAPKIVAVTGEPLPTRLASLALGTGDLDCVYHFALTELLATVADLNTEANPGISDQAEMLTALVNGKRLRDIADLPFDLIA
jgi:hypothetical protein